MMPTLRKFPRTPHLEGSRPQTGDEDLAIRPFSVLAGRQIVVEEKVDGANAGISFDEHGVLCLQSRGHFLTGGPRERHFAMFKTWAATHQEAIRDALGERYVLYGEWLYAKHTVFYDQLPHYFLAFDILDREQSVFLATAARQERLAATPIVSVPILWTGIATSFDDLHRLLGPSRYKSPAWRESLCEVCAAAGLNGEQITRETDGSDLMEGLYVKVETAGLISDRYKFVRPSFRTSIVEADSHWLNHPIVPNQLRPEVDLFASAA